ncbi:hypothetical protein, conserved [Leishmania tarentolae]|uniref:ELMO domain-containing protein n=1 Tax=Leishmania tarentolae TaxID=5689 RepID=A0A640KTY0_LEITA|nr:hypothetical protein, conserved [Leishmania tarentolae]
MSLLQKNAVLRKYRHGYHEADAGQSFVKEGTHTEETNDDDISVYPDANAFHALGSTARGVLTSPSSSSRLTRSEQTTPMTATGATTVKGGSPGESSAYHGTTTACDSRQSNTTATATAGLSTISTSLSPFPHDGADEAIHIAPTRSSRSRSRTVRAGVEAEGKYFDLDNVAAPLVPLSLPIPSVSGAPPALALVGRRGADSNHPLCGSSRSDLSGEEDRAITGTHPPSAPTDPSVSPTTVTIGGEALMSITDVPEAPRLNYIAPETATSALAPPAGEPCVPASDACGLSSSALASGKLRTLTRGAEDPNSAPRVSTAPPQPPEVLPRVYKDALVEEVSSSSSSRSSMCTALEREGDRGDVDGKPSRLREEAVRQLDLAYARATNDPLPLGGFRNSAGSAAMRLDISDTLLQPPTSILSEPSTMTLQTKDKSALSHRSSGGAAASVSVKNRRLAYAADGAEASEEGVFSPVSGMDDNERASSAGMADDRGICYADSRGVVLIQQVLSFSATTHSLPRIWDDEDIDVDLLTPMTDSMRPTSRTLLPITFYEAYLDLTKDLRGHDAKAVRQAEEREANKGSSSSSVSPQGTPQSTEAPMKNVTLSALFWCCRGASSRSSTAPKQAYLCKGDRNASDRDERSCMARTDETVAASGGPEEHLRVIRVLKSQSLSLHHPTHRRMLLTVFNTLTGKIPWPNRNANLPKSNSRTPSPLSSATAVKWESIGFQGSNPATDVRATGVLGVLQLLYLIDYYPDFAQRLWQLCRDPADEAAPHFSSPNHCGDDPRMAARRGGVSNELPFVLVCFNFTAMVLDAVGQHILDEEVQRTATGKRASSTSQEAAGTTTRPAADPSSYAGMYVCCECYVGALALFVETWKARRKGGATGTGGATTSTVPENRPSIADFGYIKARLREKLLRKGAAKIMREAACQVRGAALQQG